MEAIERSVLFGGGGRRANWPSGKETPQPSELTLGTDPLSTSAEAALVVTRLRAAIVGTGARARRGDARPNLRARENMAGCGRGGNGSDDGLREQKKR